MKQAAHTLLMIRPVKFTYNEQTAVNNYYQNKNSVSTTDVNELALKEFDALVTKLKENKIDVIEVDDTLEPHSPDSIFPNNWISFHEDGRVVLYPMFAENRRFERRKDIIQLLEDEHDLLVAEVIDYTNLEEEGMFMEGTGSLVLDRQNKVAYAAISERTNEEVAYTICDEMDYELITFVANQTVDGDRKPIYHTNVMMCVAEQFAVVCLDAIDNVADRQELIASLEETDKEIIEITEAQLAQFAGNMLQVVSTAGDPFMVMSSSAYKSLTIEQVEGIQNYCQVIHSPIDTIELLGGGSVRCMLAEVFLPKNK